MHFTVGIQVFQKYVGCFVGREHWKNLRQLIVKIIPQAVSFFFYKMEYLCTFILPNQEVDVMNT